MGLTELGCAIGFYGLWALLWKVFYKSYPSKVVKQIFQDGRMLYVISPNLSHCYATVLRFLHSRLKGQHISQLYHFAVKEYEKCYDVFLTFFQSKRFQICSMFLQWLPFCKSWYVQACSSECSIFLLTSFSWMIINLRWRLHKQDDL